MAEEENKLDSMGLPFDQPPETKMKESTPPPPDLPSQDILDKMHHLETWSHERVLRYNALNQYELIYDDIKSGKLGEDGEWFKTINKIKEEFPKPSDPVALRKEIDDALAKLE